MVATFRHETAFWSLLVCLSLAGPLKAGADATPLDQCVDRLDDRQVSQLLSFTEQSLRDQRLGSSLWYGGWMAFNLTNVAIGAWRIAVVDKQVERDGWMLASAGAGIFVLIGAVLPPPALYASRRLERMPARSPAQRRDKLRRAFALLEKANDFELRNTSWLTHVGGWFYSAASTAFMYLHNLDAEDMRSVHISSWVQFASTVVGAELTIWTVPRKARRDLAHVRQYGCPEPSVQREARTAPGLSIGAAGSYLSLRLRF